MKASAGDDVVGVRTCGAVLHDAGVEPTIRLEQALLARGLVVLTRVARAERQACEPGREGRLRSQTGPHVNEDPPPSVGLSAPDRQIVAVPRRGVRLGMIDEGARPGEPSDIAARGDIARPRLPYELV